MPPQKISNRQKILLFIISKATKDHCQTLGNLQTIVYKLSKNAQSEIGYDFFIDKDENNTSLLLNKDLNDLITQKFIATANGSITVSDRKKATNTFYELGMNTISDLDKTLSIIFRLNENNTFEQKTITAS
jgi:hypothetical protein